jgi:hypothetical protein
MRASWPDLQGPATHLMPVAALPGRPTAEFRPVSASFRLECPHPFRYPPTTRNSKRLSGYFMSNKYGIPDADEREIRARDKACVYCHIAMKEYAHTRGTPGDKATIEHLHNDGPFDHKSNLAICCGRCNSSRGNMELLDWFQTSYCKDNNINEETVAQPVQEYIRFIVHFIIRCTWTFANTMPDIPHYYIVRDTLSDDDKETFDSLSEYIKQNGYTDSCSSRAYNYLNVAGYKYWMIDNILNREKYSRY